MAFYTDDIDGQPSCLFVSDLDGTASMCGDYVVGANAGPATAVSDLADSMATYIERSLMCDACLEEMLRRVKPPAHRLPEQARVADTSGLADDYRLWSVELMTHLQNQPDPVFDGSSAWSPGDGRDHVVGHVPDPGGEGECEEVRDGEPCIILSTSGMVRCTDGVTRQANPAHIEADDIVDGHVDWPPSGCPRVEGARECADCDRASGD